MKTAFNVEMLYYALFSCLIEKSIESRKKCESDPENQSKIREFGSENLLDTLLVSMLRFLPSDERWNSRGQKIYLKNVQRKYTLASRNFGVFVGNL